MFKNSCRKCGIHLKSENSIHCQKCKEKTTVEFLSKHPHTTCWIHLQYPVDKYPIALVSQLEQIGFVRDEFASLPPLDGIAELELGKAGSDLFQGWTTTEKRSNMRVARKTLAVAGFLKVPHRKLRPIDLI